jgi:transposase InsO family protein
VIKQVFSESKGTYGSPRITANLKRQGYLVSKPRVAKLMRKSGLRSKTKKKYRVTTDSNHGYSISKNHLSRNFKPKELNETWVSDITYIKTGQGWLYLTTVIDLFDRQVIGWALSKSLFAKETIIPAWNMALSKRSIDKPLIFHSDRGVQYASKEFRKQLKANCLIVQSMSRKGNCWDNAVAESFFKTLKSELIYHEDYKMIEEAKTAVFEYIETWYNNRRLHSSLNYKTPKEVELEFMNIKNAA